MPILRILTLKCITQEDLTGDDDTYITINHDKFWGPKTFDDGQRRTINQDHTFNYRAEIRLYDRDTESDDDFLGSHTVTRQDIGKGEQIISFTEDDASYEMWIEVLEESRDSRTEVEDRIDRAAKPNDFNDDDRAQVEKILRENYGPNFDKMFPTEAARRLIVDDVLKAISTEPESDKFNRWKCARCVAINLALGIAIAYAIAQLGPVGPEFVITFLKNQFDLTVATAEAIVIVFQGGGSGAMIAKKLCKDC